MTRRALISAITACTFTAATAGCDAHSGTISEAVPVSTRTAVPAAVHPTAPLPSPTTPQQSTLGPATRASLHARFDGHRPSQWGLDLPEIATHTGSASVALTFDACGGPGGSGFDARLIDTLRSLNVHATLFLNARWIAANPSLSKELADDSLFEIANHGMAHVPLSTTGRSAYGIAGTASLDAVLDEVDSGASAHTALTGETTPWFRTGTAFYDDIAVQAVRAMGLIPVNFTVNSDGGATFPPSTVAAQLATVRPGDIVIGHMNQAGSGTSAGYEMGLPKMIARGLNFTTLSRTTIPVPGRPSIG